MYTSKNKLNRNREMKTRVLKMRKNLCKQYKETQCIVVQIEASNLWFKPSKWWKLWAGDAVQTLQVSKV